MFQKEPKEPVPANQSNVGEPDDFRFQNEDDECMNQIHGFSMTIAAARVLHPKGSSLATLTWLLLGFM